MDRTVGRFLWGLLLSMHSYGEAAQVTLQALDMDNKVLQKAVIGEPCKLVVSFSGGTIERAELKNNESMTINGRETRMHIINGHRTTDYIYIVSFEKIGTHEVGPATVISDGEKIVSNKVTITVENEKSSAASKHSSLFARLYTTKKTAFIGERIECFLEIYCADDAIQLRNIEQPKTSSATVNLIKPPYVLGTKVMNGTTYTCARCIWDIYPTQSGKLIIPALAIDYAFQPKNSAVGFFWTPSYTVKRVYSNALSLEVAALPPHDPPIAILGDFTAFTARLEPKVCTQGDGMVLTLELIGDGNAIAMPPLVDMPTSFKWYESKTYEAPAKNDTTPIKRFEYIVQGMQSGDWKIPAQQLTYFNVKLKRYVTLKTDPIKVKINPASSNSVQNKARDVHESIDTLSSDSSLADDEDIRPIYEVDDTQRYNPWALPQSAFMILVSIPFIVGILLRVKRTLNTHKKITLITKKKIFGRAHKELQKAIKDNAPERIYSLFGHVFTTLHRQSGITSPLTEHDIEHIVKKAALSDEHMKEWYDFWVLAAAALFSHERNHYEHRLLFSQAQQWLNRLEKTL